MGDLQKKIVVDDISASLYEYYIATGNNRFANILYAFILWPKFQDALIKLRRMHLEDLKLNINYKHSNIDLLDFNAIQRTVFFAKQPDSWKRNFRLLSKPMIASTFLQIYKKQFLENDTTININKLHLSNSSNIFHTFTKEDFALKYLRASIHKSIHGTTIDNEDSQQFSNNIANDDVISTPSGKPIRVNGPQKIEDTREIICKISISEQTGKKEILDYIENNFDEIEKILQPTKKRVASKVHLLRDIDLYNKYQTNKADPKIVAGPDVATWSWLKKNKKYNIKLEPNTIAKRVSELSKKVKDLSIDI